MVNLKFEIEDLKTTISSLQESALSIRVKELRTQVTAKEQEIAGLKAGESIGLNLECYVKIKLYLEKWCKNLGSYDFEKNLKKVELALQLAVTESLESQWNTIKGATRDTHSLELKQSQTLKKNREEFLAFLQSKLDPENVNPTQEESAHFLEKAKKMLNDTDDRIAQLEEMEKDLELPEINS